MNDTLRRWLGILTFSIGSLVFGYFLFWSIAASNSWALEPGALMFFLIISYTGGLIPMTIAFLIAPIRRAMTRKVWIVLLIFVGVHAISFLPYLVASYQNNPSSLEALWLPMPMGIVVFFLTCVAVIAHIFVPRKDPKAVE